MAEPAPAAPLPPTIVKVFGNIQRTGTQVDASGNKNMIFYKNNYPDEIDLQETVSVNTVPAPRPPALMENALVFAAMGGITPDPASKGATCKGKDYTGTDGKTYRVICASIFDRTMPQVYQTTSMSFPDKVDRPKVEYSGKRTFAKVIVPVYEVVATGGRRRRRHSKRHLKSRQRGGKSRRNKSRRKTRRH